MRDYDVVISGYGPAGAVAANLLGERGVRVLVLEPSEEIYDIPRAVHFDGEVMRIFQAMGLEKEIESVSGTATALAFVNGWGLTLMSADVTQMPTPNGWPTGNFFNQPMLEQHLRRGAARFPSVDVRLGWALEGFSQDEAGVDVRARRVADGETQAVRAAYLLGSDGASSPTRRQTGIELEDLECDEPWLVCDLILEEGTPIERTAVQICDPKRPTTLVPCEATHIRWEFMLRPGDDPESLEEEATARAMMAPHMDRLAPGLSADRGELIRSKVYTFHALVARTFQDHRVFLLGDAAHQTPPFLGQGLCAGVRDAYNLCWKLTGVLEGRYSESILDTYTSERRPHARAVVSQAVRTGAVIQTTSRWRAFTRDLFLLLGRVIPRLTAPLAWAPTWTLGPGLFDASGPPDRECGPGHPIDQPMVETPGGERERLDELLGDGFALVGLGVDPAGLLDASGLEACKTLAARSLQVGAEGEVYDVEGGLAAWAERVGAGRVAVVRPDRQVYGVFGGSTDEELGQELSAALVRLVGRLAA